MRNTDGGVLLLVKLQAYQIAQCIIYIHQVWDYSTVNLESIKKAISNFNWNKAFENLCIYETVGLLNQTLLNIFRNYIPNKKDLECDYRQPPWMTDKTNSLLKERRKLTKYFLQKWSSGK